MRNFRKAVVEFQASAPLPGIGTASRLLLTFISHHLNISVTCCAMDAQGAEGLYRVVVFLNTYNTLPVLLKCLVKAAGCCKKLRVFRIYSCECSELEISLRTGFSHLGLPCHLFGTSHPQAGTMKSSLQMPKVSGPDQPAIPLKSSGVCRNAFSIVHSLSSSS